MYDVRLRDPQGRQYSRTFETLAEARAFEASERSDQRRGRWIDPRRSEAKFSEVAAGWLEASAHKRASSIERDRAIISRHLLPVLGGRRLASITPTEIQRIVDAWTAKAAPATVARQYATLRAIFTHAVVTDSLVRSPCRGVRLPTVKPRQSTLVNADGLQALADAMTGMEPMPYLGGVLGLRWADVAGLRVGAFDFFRNTVSIDRQWTRGAKGAMVSQDPKSRAGIRTLSVPDWLMAMVSDHLAARGLTGADPDAPVFTTVDGKPLHYSNWRQRVWLPATKAAGLPGLHFHDLKHTAGTAMVASGIDAKTAQVRLGHAYPATTLRIYAQATPSADKDAAQRLGDPVLTSRGETIAHWHARWMCDGGPPTDPRLRRHHP
ncbi:MAG: tyrosine-type recombinase/integrase [Candidatus Dormibacteria bacterium]